MTEQHDINPNDPVRVTSDPEMVEKLHDVIDGMDVAMVSTRDSSDPNGRLTSRPLSTQRQEDTGDVLFLTRRSSAFVRDILADPKVNVAYASKSAWVSLAGTAEVVEDRGLVGELWSKGADMFMDGGPDNPDNIVVRVTGDTAELWGGESIVGAAVSMVKAVTGSKGDDEGATVVDLD